MSKNHGVSNKMNLFFKAIIAKSCINPQAAKVMSNDKDDGKNDLSGL